MQPDTVQPEVIPANYCSGITRMFATADRLFLQYADGNTVLFSSTWTDELGITEPLDQVYDFGGGALLAVTKQGNELPLGDSGGSSLESYQWALGLTDVATE